MEDYWGSKADGAGVTNGEAKAGGEADAPPSAIVEDEDIDMIT